MSGLGQDSALTGLRTDFPTQRPPCLRLWAFSTYPADHDTRQPAEVQQVRGPGGRDPSQEGHQLDRDERGGQQGEGKGVGEVGGVWVR